MREEDLYKKCGRFSQRVETVPSIILRQPHALHRRPPVTIGGLRQEHRSHFAVQEATMPCENCRTRETTGSTRLIVVNNKPHFKRQHGSEGLTQCFRVPAKYVPQPATVVVHLSECDACTRPLQRVARSTTVSTSVGVFAFLPASATNWT